MNKDDLIQQLSLEKHIEGGYFVETYRSEETVSTNREGNERSILTSIYYLLTDDRPINYLHKNKSDILHYFHLGSPITYITVSPQGELKKVKLGLNIAKGEVPQLLVPGGYWKTALLEEGEFGLLGESVSPGFEYKDMEIAKPNSFRALFPQLRDELSPYIQSES